MCHDKDTETVNFQNNFNQPIIDMSPILFFIFTACDSNLIESNINDSDEKSSTCDINILESTPFPDSTNAYYRYPIQVLLSDNDPTASLSVTTSETEVSGVVENEENTLTFTPTDPLPPFTEGPLSNHNPS